MDPTDGNDAALHDLLARLSTGADGDDPRDRAAAVRDRMANQARVRRTVALAAAGVVLVAGAGAVIGRAGIFSSDSTVSLPRLDASASVGAGASIAASGAAVSTDLPTAAAGSSSAPAAASAAGTLPGHGPTAGAASGSARSTASPLATRTGAPTTLPSASGPGASSPAGTASFSPSPYLGYSLSRTSPDYARDVTLQVQLSGAIPQYVDPVTGALLSPDVNAPLYTTITYGDGASGGSSRTDLACRAGTPLVGIFTTLTFTHTYTRPGTYEIRFETAACSPVGKTVVPFEVVVR